MKRQDKDILYFEISSQNKPTLYVKPGEDFEVRTQLNRGPFTADHPDGQAVAERLRGGNPSSGCIWIEGAEAGDVLSIHIGEISLDPIGFTAFRGSTGAMPAYLGSTALGAHHRLVEIRDGFIQWSDNLKLPVAPMIGFIGVAPLHEAFSHAWGSYYGGNFDVQEITTGAVVELVVNVPGALLHVGDMHARQGDGEICGAGGIEASGVVRLRCELNHQKPNSMYWPRILDDTHISTAAMARPAEDAFRLALESMVLWLEEEYGFGRGEAFLYLGQVLEARCTQFVNPTFTYLAKVHRQFLPDISC